MAFENYALYPPLTVEENLTFPLKARGLPKSEIYKNLQHIVEMLKIKDILNRRPAELSGGQQQRISLGRCIIRDSDVYLMDEPLSHLDSELRLHMRGELKRIHEFGNHTIIYVTHDQIEALALADRIAIMDNGCLQQIGTSEQVYNHPDNLFVAGFIGEPQMNFISGTLDFENGSVLFRTKQNDLQLQLPQTFNRFLDHYRHKKLVLAIRPHYLHLGKKDRLSQYETVSVLYESLGEEGVLEVQLNNKIHLLILTEPDLNIKPGSSLSISIDWQYAHLFDPNTGESLNQES
jgi:multiple sugar transport system ATP-binding protein